MAKTTLIKIRGKTLPVTWQPTQSKSDLARYLLDEGYTVSEISKAVPMAYSQVHQLNKAKGELKRHEIPKNTRHDHTVGTGWGNLPPTARTQKKALKPQKLKPLQKTNVSPRVGKLRTPGLPSDIEVGPCANCGYDVALRRLSTGFALIHINISSEEYLAVAQFCSAVPQVLVS